MFQQCSGGALFFADPSLEGYSAEIAPELYKKSRIRCGQLQDLGQN